MESNTQVSDLNSETSSEAVNQQSVEDKVAYSTYRKAVGQVKAHKSRVEELESVLASHEQDKKIADGKKDEVISALRKQVSDLETKNNERDAAYTWNVVGAQIKSELAGRGVSNTEKALKFATAAHRDDLNAIEVDGSYKVNNEDLTRFVDKFLTENADMGFVASKSVKDISPKAKMEFGGNEKKASDMSADELKQLLKSNF